MSTRRFFTKAIAPPPKPRRPNHKGKALLVKLGSGQYRTMSSRQWAHAVGASKGGQVTAGRDNPGRFTSETGRAAILKCWKTRWRKVRGMRIGRSVSKPINHATLRDRHSRLHGTPLDGEIYYAPETRQWFVVCGLQGGVLYQRSLSERAALTRLGYLKKRRGHIYVPQSTDQIMDCWVGIHPAKRRTQEENVT